MQDSDQSYTMTARDIAIAEAQANFTVSKLVAAAKDKELTGEILNTWSGHLYQIVGKAVFRLALYLFLVVCVLGSYKFGLMDKVMEIVRR